LTDSRRQNDDFVTDGRSLDNTDGTILRTAVSKTPQRNIIVLNQPVTVSMSCG